ncbi:hypothetical protein D1J63_26125 [Streptomyces sp. KPB2]|uniref:hypothetical protein n=1 Tax=Streptomyces sp. KPB2 TaxID=2305221 RepID=UPI000F6F82B6|nr:hypothetical protein [Streptomyces sp. KPB2]AZM78016.1 hypothetical protein D1J63_26125 [Streptomyces sp. KPB2]
MGSTTPGWLALPEDEFEERYRPPRGFTSGYLHRVLVRALGPAVNAAPSDEALKRKPLVLDLTSPLPPRLRFYLYAATQHQSERQPGTFKIQLSVGVTRDGKPAPPRAKRRWFDRTDNIRPIAIGYHPDWNLFILWDADLHDLNGGFGSSKNVQTPPEIVWSALAKDISHGSRRLHGGLTETIVAARPHRLVEALSLRIDLSNESMCEGLF